MVVSVHVDGHLLLFHVVVNIESHIFGNEVVQFTEKLVCLLREVRIYDSRLTLM